MKTKTRTIKGTLLAQALALAFGVSSLPAFAQSNATGSIYGQVPGEAGLTVVLENEGTGVHRTITPDHSGKFQATSMPPGHYKVSLMRGPALVQALEVEALVGKGVEASFAGASGVQTVTVAARVSRIDVSNTNNGAVFTSKELAALPIGQNLAAIIQLAPGTNKYTLATYGSSASFGGAGASENSFYVNGFPITNILTQVGASELPFGSIANAQVLSGGYGAEFGRSTGGVINITTKSGTNSWEAGGKLTYAPGTLRSAPKNTYYPNTGANPLTDGKLYSYAQDNATETKTAGLYVGGPLVKDKLFMFAALEQSRTNLESVASNSATAVSPTGFSESGSTVSRYLVKLDYNLSDDHHLEFTKIYDRTETLTRSFGFDYNTLSRNNVQKGAATFVNCCGAAAPGANDSIFKYTGYLSDNFTITALYGESKTGHTRTPEGYNPAVRQTSSSPSTRVPGLVYNNLQTVTGSLPTPDSGDQQKTFRLDLEYKLGNHSLRGGIDRNRVSSVVGSTSAGGGVWSYHKNVDPNKKPYGAFESPAQGGGYGTQGYFVSEDLTNNVAHPSSTQSAQYIQDRYQVLDNVLLDLGLRDEQFTNNNSVGQPFISQKHQVAPRLGVSWDVNRDGTLKVFANAGRYFLQVPTNLSSNVAGVFLSTQKNYTYTGVDPTTGAPTGLHPISDVVSANNAFGISRDPRVITAVDIKPLYQDEMSLGFEKAWSPSLNVGLMATYRTLRSTNDDFCDQRPIDAWGLRNGVDTSNFAFNCAIINPGVDNTLMLDLAGDGKLTRVELSAADIGHPKLKRTYAALNVFAEHPFRNGWYGKINYTLSQSKGNSEGQVDSIGGGDVALTVGWDHKELMLNSYGYLPNDHTHVIKAFGYYQLNPEWSVGGNANITSGRPRNCIGNLPESAGPDMGYGGSYFFCNGVATPRGSQGRLPWDMQLDFNVAYTPAAFKGLRLKVDVFNVFNRQTVTSVNEAYNNEDAISANYLQVQTRAAPRATRLTAEYNYKF
ncbi:MAG: TonB-dependent receptor [Pseudomonadota bacterium]